MARPTERETRGESTGDQKRWSLGDLEHRLHLMECADCGTPTVCNRVGPLDNPYACLGRPIFCEACQKERYEKSRRQRIIFTAWIVIAVGAALAVVSKIPQRIHWSLHILVGLGCLAVLIGVPLAMMLEQGPFREGRK